MKKRCKHYVKLQENGPTNEPHKGLKPLGRTQGPPQVYVQGTISDGGVSSRLKLSSYEVIKTTRARALTPS